MRRTFGGLVAVLALTLIAACGGRQEAVDAPVVQEAVGCCIEDRWETPPANIGDTPGVNAPPAPANALQPFEPPE